MKHSAVPSPTSAVPSPTSAAVAPLPVATSGPTLTVVVPALDEAERLPVLLDALDAQTVRADAVVLADARSTDATREIAAARGVIVVEGGMPAIGRNAGAAVAESDLILFLDADNVPVPGFIEHAVAEFLERDLTVATAHIAPLEDTPGNRFACEAANLYLDLMQYVAPHAPGFCILITRAAHVAINGFDETVLLAEDHDYVQRAAERGRFRVLRCEPMTTSMRRIGKEGIVRLAFKYLYCEVYAVQGKPIHRVPFDYEFGAFEPAEKAAPLVSVSELRTALGDAVDVLTTFSADGLERLRQLGETAVDAETFADVLRNLAPEDTAGFERYVRVRLKLAHRGGKRAAEKARRVNDMIWQRLSDDSSGY